jgi:hypothetical protein
MNRSFYLQLFVSMVALATVTLLWVIPAQAQFNEQINYQGRLLDSTGSAVVDGTYAMSFRLYTVATSGSAIWTETLSGASEVTVIDGLFSVMLGSTTPLSSVDFNQTLYLGVTIEADSEMAPRKILGAVPAAFVANEAINANTVGGVASTSLLRNDQVGTVTASSSSSILSVIQNGLGKIASFFSGATEVFTILNNGNVGIGTSTPSSRLSVVGNAVIGGNLTATGTLTVGSLTGLLLGTNGTVSAISTSTLNLDLANTVGTLGATRGGTGLSAITQHQLLIGGAGNTWTQVSTSSLGLAGLSDLAAYLPLVGGSLTGNLTLSGSVANIVLGNNWLSGDGGDEGVFVSSTGLVGIGTSTPSNKLDIWGSVQIGTSSTPTLLVDTTNRQLIIGATTTTNPAAGIYMHDREFTIDNSGHIGTYSVVAEPAGVLAFYATGGNIEFRRNGINGLQLTSNGITINPNNSNSMDFIIDGDVSNNLLFADVSTENIGIGTSSPSSKLTVVGTAEVTGTTTLATTTVTNLTLTGAFRDATNSAGTSGMVLQSTGTSTRWVATSTLGITGGGGSSALSGLSDVSLSGLATGQLLSYNGSVWNNVATSSLGLGNGTFLGLSDTPSAYTANRIMFTNSGATALTDSANLLFDGSQLATLNLAVSGTSTFSGTTTMASTSITGTLQMGTTSLASRFMLDVNNFSAAGIAGLNRFYTGTNAASGTVQFGEQGYFKNSATATTTIVGSMFRIEDSSTLGNTVRGLEVQTNRGSNTQGENTALSGFARTFGVRGFTSADAGGRFEPAGGYFETGGTTQGNAIRGYSSSITSANLLALFQDTSTFSGTGLNIDLGNGTGSFTGKFLDLKVAGATRFNVASTGTMFTQGDVSIVTTDTDPAANNVVGMYFGANGFASINRSGNPAMNLGRSNDGAVLQFYSAGAVQGSVSIAGATVSYNAFTGSHFGLVSTTTTLAYEKGTLLELTGENAHYNDDTTSEIIYGMQQTTTENSSRVIGTYLASLEPSQPQSTTNPTLVMAVGNGHMWVADQGEDVEAGDYLISSNITGHAEKDSSTSSVSYIIARASEDIDWNSVDEDIDGVKHKLITVFFENFTRPNVDFALVASSTIGLESVAEDSFTNTFLKGLFAKIAEWVGDAQNGIGSMYANVFNASERICVDDECLTADDIRSLKGALGEGGSSNPPEESGGDTGGNTNGEAGVGDGNNNGFEEGNSNSDNSGDGEDGNEGGTNGDEEAAATEEPVPEVNPEP